MKKENQENSYNYREGAAFLRDVLFLLGLSLAGFAALIIAAMYIWG